MRLWEFGVPIVGRGGPAGEVLREVFGRSQAELLLPIQRSANRRSGFADLFELSDQFGVVPGGRYIEMGDLLP